MATHVYSGTRIFTDAPLDNNGKAQSFSPTDLVATALGACMVTIMGIEANKLNVNIDGTKMTVQKTMVSNPRRISKVQIVFEVPGAELSDGNRLILENAARNCPVAKSIHPEIIQETKFNYV